MLNINGNNYFLFVIIWSVLSNLVVHIYQKLVVNLIKTNTIQNVSVRLRVLSYFYGFEKFNSSICYIVVIVILIFVTTY